MHEANQRLNEPPKGSWPLGMPALPVFVKNVGAQIFRK